MNEAATRIEVSLSRGEFSLDVSLAWDARVAVIFGPSGSGKSTLLEAVLGLLPADAARIRVGGTVLEDRERGVRLRPEQRRLGWVPQDALLFPHLSVAQNLAFAAKKNVPAAGSALARASEALEIGNLLGRRAHELSGGERQRVAIARALAGSPRALLLDEPLASLDLPLRARVLRHLLRMRDELEIPILWITHDPDEAQIAGEFAVVIEKGRVVASGPPREVLWSRAVLLDEPLASLDLPLRARVLRHLLRMRDELEIPILWITHDPDEAQVAGEIAVVLEKGRFVAAGPPREVLWSRAVLPLSEALGLENTIDGQVVATGAHECSVETPRGLRLVLPMALPIGERVSLGLRAHDVLLSADPPGRVSARNLLPARVERIDVAEGAASVTLDAGEKLVAKLTVGAVERLGLRPGSHVHALIKAQALRRIA